MLLIRRRGPTRLPRGGRFALHFGHGIQTGREDRETGSVGRLSRVESAVRLGKSGAGVGLDQADV